MSPPPGKHSHLEVGEDGSLVIPPDLARRYGLAPGATVPVEELDNHLVLHQPVSLLAKIHLEPTKDCPLARATCMRNAWKEPPGWMEARVFDRILEGLRGLPSIPAVFFGGIGEPLAHPGLPGMLRQVKTLGARMDGGGEWDHDLAGIIADCGLHYADGRVSTRAENACPFIEGGSACIRWDGSVSACLPLLHSHETWLGSRRRQIREHSFGSVMDRSLEAIWNDEAYVGFRRRVQDFDFPPCVRCNSCDWIDSNQEDCFRNPPPACGGCLRAQGFILCP